MDVLQWVKLQSEFTHFVIWGCGRFLGYFYYAINSLAYLMNKNHEIQNSLTDSGEQNLYMMKVAMENGALAAKLAGAGGGGTIIALTLEPERTIRALKDAGAEEFVELAPKAEGVKVEVVGKGAVDVFSAL